MAPEVQQEEGLRVFTPERRLRQRLDDIAQRVGGVGVGRVELEEDLTFLAEGVGGDVEQGHAGRRRALTEVVVDLAREVVAGLDQHDLEAGVFLAQALRERLRVEVALLRAGPLPLAQHGDEGDAAGFGRLV
ncbi:MAG: hypothetical protein IPM79_30140 [Polyangiaceae bacterium]|nr:hypothetical protein [Polyangiaceae bacterium]